MCWPRFYNSVKLRFRSANCGNLGNPTHGRLCNRLPRSTHAGPPCRINKKFRVTIFGTTARKITKNDYTVGCTEWPCCAWQRMKMAREFNLTVACACTPFIYPQHSSALHRPLFPPCYRAGAQQQKVTNASCWLFLCALCSVLLWRDNILIALISG